MRSLIPIGFWLYTGSPDVRFARLPLPQSLVRPNQYTEKEKANIMQYLRSGTVYETYRGLSFCRFKCDVDPYEMGHREYTDGVWVWPEGLAHYIECHDVILPDDFVQHARRHDWKAPADLDVSSLGDYDPEYTTWVLWAQYEGRSSQ